MREFKKLASLVLALVMAFALAAPAFATGPDLEQENSDTQQVTYEKVTIKVPANSENHEYAVYQIFKGKPEKNNETGAVTNSLTNIDWGDGIADRAGFIEDLKNQDALKGNAAIAALTADSSAPEVAQAIFSATGGRDRSDEAKAVQAAAEGNLSGASSGQVMQGDKEGTIGQDFETGYYIIMDTDKSTTPPTTKYTLLRVTGNAQIQIKSPNVPDLDKEVQDSEDSSQWGDKATYPVDPDATEGTPVNFRLVATLPENYDPNSSDAYKLIFHDTQDVTLQFDPESVVVTVDGTVITDYIVVTDPTDDCTFEISIADLKKVTDNVTFAPNSEIVVSYTSTLLPGATVGGLGNKNTVTLEYGVNGESNPAVTTVFTFQLTVNKFDGVTKQPLVGAEFLLEKLVDGKWTTVKEYSADNGLSEFVFAKLSAGRYRLTETAVIDPYNRLTDPIYFTVSYSTTTDSSDRLIIDEVSAVQTEADGSKLTGESTLTFTGDEAGELVTNVNNFSGVVLPETGGIGTTIFYIVGGILVVGAVVLLITKRRMGASEE